MLRELREAVANVRREYSTRCLVLTSKVSGTFCAGADLKVRSVQLHADTCGVLRTL